MSQEAHEAVRRRREKVQAIVDAAGAPLCLHDVITQHAWSPTDPGAVFIVLSLLEALARGVDGAPPSIGAARVRAGEDRLLHEAPRDLVCWPLSPGFGNRPEALARFGTDWQGERLAARVREHAQRYPGVLKRHRWMDGELHV
ncbi:MAG: hypothetical protein L3K09_01535 [Thermoplasmata archaeon]|nr:hypothetical protein [Thermoplasmata archaeon]